MTTTPIGRTLQSQRNGVILLLVLAMLAMFAMLIATFMVVSSQQFRQADSVQKLDRYTYSPKDDLNSVIIQMLVGGNAKTSVIRAHSLGATMYGDVSDATMSGLSGTATWVSTFGDNNELHRFNLATSPNSLIDFLASIGNVFTVRAPDTLKWHSARIVDAGEDGSYYVTVRDFPGISNPSIFNGSEFIINPPAFTGTGAGYDAAYFDETDPAAFWTRYAEPRLSESDAGMPFAHQLNPNAPLSDGTPGFGLMLDNFKWKLNADYTAPDTASPFLAWQDGFVTIPSYHRPALVAAYGYDGEDSLRKVVMRPLPFDHQEFDGSNPPLGISAYINGNLVDNLINTNYLDVDTDGDGVKDSIWVDVGLPVRTDINGRTYKPLVAIKCVDLDGRLNVNAHGNLAQLDNDIMLGSGFGPAGTDLTRGLLSLPSSFQTTIPTEMAAELLLQRYLGAHEQLDTSVPRNPDSLTGSMLAQFSMLPSSTPLYNFFGNLPDYWDQGALDYDPLGNRYNHFDEPYHIATGGVGVAWDIPIDTNPYLFDPNRRTPYDQPFTLPELEAVLRQNDIDKDVLPARLRKILGFIDDTGFVGEPDILKVAAYNVTTMSNDAPVPGPALADQGYTSLYALIRSCAVKSGAANPDAVAVQLIDYLPDEIKQGGKINLNKLVEDPNMILSPASTNYENALYERMKMARGIYIILMALSFDKLYGIPDGAGGYLVEPYIEPSFMQADKIIGLFRPTETTYNPVLGYKVCRELATTRLAQWAVNVVDFTDLDAIMTPFIFDVNPFDGNAWGSRDSDIGIWNEFACVGTQANYRLVWGMERPDLLLTETLAFHNRNVANTTEGGKTLEEADVEYFDEPLVTGGKWRLKDEAPQTIKDKYHNQEADNDYDQVRMP